MPVVSNATLAVDGLELSAIRGEPDEAARATVLALPGGGYNSAYWHHPRIPDGSLVALGAMLGLRTISLDRPGYGATAAQFPDGCGLDRQVDAIFALVEQLASEPGAGEGVFLVGHSMGAIIALRAAARCPHGLLGVDVSGIPLRFSENLATAVAANLGGDEDHSPGQSAAAMFYGPEGSFDPGLLINDVSLAPPPPIELADSMAWPDQFAQVAAQIAVPVRITLGEYETVTATGWPALRETAALFTRSARVETALQAGAGHNVSLHHIAGAFHLRVLAFFDESLALA